MNLTRSFLIALILSFVSLGYWEYHVRSQGFNPRLDDNKNLWANQRVRVNRASESDVVLIGSSRVLFDIQLNEWEELTDVRPIQLALVGSSAIPIFDDVVNNTDFKGTIIVGITPGLFFGEGGKSRPKKAIKYFNDRTYAQRLNHTLSIPLQRNLTFMSATENESADDLDLKSMLKQIKYTDRVIDPMPPFNNFYTVDLDRNGRMIDRYANDTIYSNIIKRVWKFFTSEPPKDPPPKDEMIDLFVEDANVFKQRGGKIILLRLPSTDYTRDLENKGMPRNDFWDELIVRSELKGYHFEDYDEFKYYDCPEWSHLSEPDAQKYTTDLVKIMLKDGVITNYKN